MKTLLAFLLLIHLIHGLGTWKLYSKAGCKSWEAFIPIYSIIILIKIINRPRWWIILLILPVINVIMIPVIWVELSRSFGKNNYLDTLLSILTLGFYNYYLNYFVNVEYVTNRDTNPKSSNGEWTSSLIFAIVAAIEVYLSLPSLYLLSLVQPIKLSLAPNEVISEPKPITPKILPLFLSLI